MTWVFMRFKGSSCATRPIGNDRQCIESGRLTVQEHMSRQLDYRPDGRFLAVVKCIEILSVGAYIIVIHNRRKTPTNTSKCDWHNRELNRRYIKKQEKLALPALAVSTGGLFATHSEILSSLTGYEP